MTCWPLVRLDEIAEVRLGRQRSPKNHVGHDMRPYLRAANVGWDGLLLDDVKAMNFTAAEMKTYRLEPGDLLLNEASGSRHEVGKPALWQGEIPDCAFQNTLLRVRPRKASSRFLLHYFRHTASKGGFAERSRGVGIHHLGRDTLSSLPTPLPPVDEQKRIADILDHAESLHVKRLRTLVLLENLVQSIFLDMFGHPLTSPRYAKVRLGDVTAYVRGVAFKPEQVSDSADPQSAACLTTKNVQRTLNLSAITFIPASVVRRDDQWLREGDTLISSANSWNLVGRCCFMPPLEAPATFGAFVSVLRPTVDELSAKYLHHWFASPAVQTTVRSFGRQTTNIANLDVQRTLDLSLPMPSLEEQERFITALAARRATTARLETSQQELDRLRAALRARAFRGEL
ncbi:restriction endonuclease subunit S [Geodermatophilus sp. TF02-6]|uniref:restriction endonuclease subunit S n=1 Tax=Geodermatophilus sp. TF02-6 TaxID=2250575 RepID=UPI000DE9B25F|nr:restriction endonuclease subunit S [Geodermatophilus sp. TF02-6]RBY80908.1 restriction endonuclease subunit S [Geodermatophilus sp. TF02-6]